MMQYVALDYSPKGIRANCVAPGWFNAPSKSKIIQGGEIVEMWTKAYTLERWGTTEDVNFLVSEEARSISGTVYEVDGGLK